MMPLVKGSTTRKNSVTGSWIPYAPDMLHKKMFYQEGVGVQVTMVASGI
jgi:predicted small secreted protein